MTASARDFVSASSLLQVDRLTVGYGHVGVLTEVSLAVQAGTIVSIVGSNGAGKSTLLRSLSGLLRPASGKIRFDGRDLTGVRPDRIVAAGLLHVAEGRRLFRSQTVSDNLELGYFGETAGRKVEAERRQGVLDLFPVLGERLNDQAGVLSGGQQQMLAIAQALMRAPKLLLLDEPSLGLAPIVIDQVFDVIKRLRSLGTTILLVEQIVERALEVADRVYVMRTGSVIGSGTPGELQTGSLIKSAYLGSL